MPLPTSITLGGVPVFLMEPHALDSRENALAMRGAIVEAPAPGAWIIDKNDAAPTGRHQFQFICESHEERAALQEFYDARFGMAENFWFPTWQWEFELRGYILPSGPSPAELWVKRWLNRTFVDSYFPIPANRKLMITHGDDYAVYTVTAAEQDGTYPTLDHLTLFQNIAGSVPAMGLPIVVNDRWRPLWLRYGRFDMDSLREIGKTVDGAAVFDVAMMECPDDAP